MTWRWTGCELARNHARRQHVASRASHAQGWIGSRDKPMRHFTVEGKDG